MVNYPVQGWETKEYNISEGRAEENSKGGRI